MKVKRKVGVIMNTARYERIKMDRNHILVTMLIGFIIGICFGLITIFMMNGAASDKIALNASIVFMYGVAFTGVPYVWTKLPAIGGFGLAAIVLFFIKLIIAGMLGMFITPIMLIVKTIQSMIYKNQDKIDEKLHSYNYNAL